ncbi:MAG: GNAT family N-acetyltransferase [Cyanobacteria bacterium P01_G01_bin.38]
MASLSMRPWLVGETLVRHGLTFRPITDDDHPFLFQLYASTREKELETLPWSAVQKQAFLQFQFKAQHTFCQEQFKDADFWVIEQAGASIGRLYIDRRADEIRIIDIALTPTYCDRGIGAALLNTVLAAAQANSQPVTIHVERNNRALNLYRRLGFVQKGEESVYYLMVWTPSIHNTNLGD